MDGSDHRVRRGAHRSRAGPCPRDAPAPGSGRVGRDARRGDRVGACCRGRRVPRRLAHRPNALRPSGLIGSLGGPCRHVPCGTPRRRRARRGLGAVGPPGPSAPARPAGGGLQRAGLDGIPVFADAEPGWEAYAARQGIGTILAERDSPLDRALAQAGWLGVGGRGPRLPPVAGDLRALRRGLGMNGIVTRLRHRDVLGAAGAALLGLIVGVTSLRFWEWRPGVPLSLDGDSPLVLTQLRDILVNGWFWSNDTIGFPLGQNASFFPELNVVHILGVKVLGLFSSDPTTVGTLYFLLGYPLAAVTAYLLARSQRLVPPAAVVVGVLFAAAPGHAERFEHLWLASYWTLPLGALGGHRGGAGSHPLGRAHRHARPPTAAGGAHAAGTHAGRAQRRLLRGLHPHPPRCRIPPAGGSGSRPSVVAGRHGHRSLDRRGCGPPPARRQDRDVGRPPHRPSSRDAHGPGVGAVCRPPHRPRPAVGGPPPRAPCRPDQRLP